MGVGEGLSGLRKGLGGWEIQSLRAVCVGERRDWSEGLISFGCGRGPLGAEKGLKGGGRFSHCVLCVWVRGGRGQRD